VWVTSSSCSVVQGGSCSVVAARLVQVAARLVQAASPTTVALMFTTNNSRWSAANCSVVQVVVDQFYRVVQPGTTSGWYSLVLQPSRLVQAGTGTNSTNHRSVDVHDEQLTPTPTLLHLCLLMHKLHLCHPFLSDSTSSDFTLVHLARCLLPCRL
jgi:hypothetical protein